MALADEYKYDKNSVSQNRNPEEMGVFVVETGRTVSGDTVTTRMAIAREITEDAIYHTRQDEGLTEANACEKYGILYMKYGASYVTTADISSVSENTITFIGDGLDGETLEIGYYAIGTGFQSGDSDDAEMTLLRPDTSQGGGDTMSSDVYRRKKEIYHAFSNAMDFKSPIDFADNGYLWADRLCFDRVNLDGLSSWDIMLDTSEDDHTNDYLVEYDTNFPIIITEISLYIPTRDFCIKVNLNSDRAGSGDEDVGQGTNGYICLDDSSCVYKQGDGYHLELRTGNIKTKGLQVKGSKGEGVTGTALVQVSGYYKPYWSKNSP